MDSDPQLITDATAIVAAMTGNTNYPAPAPALPDVGAAVDNFVAGVAAAADGGLALTSAKNDLRAILIALLRELASYVQVTCKGDLTKLLTSGFPIQKPQRQPIGTLPAPANLIVKLGGVSGELDAKADPVFGAATYNWRLSTTIAPTVTLQSGQSTAASTTFGGLMPGTSYNIEVNALGAAGPSDWSNPVSQIAV
ncbi:MAG: fibronectin type III domain-containing protein [Limisphaerales bacterium]